jgi:hypothetical protein
MAAINAKIAEAREDNNFQRRRALEVEKAKIRAAYGGGGRSSSGGGKRESNGGMKTNEAISIIKQYESWNKEHEGQEWKNPLSDAYEEALETLNHQSPAPYDVDDANSVYSWAQSLLEHNAENGYPATPDALYQAIAAVGGYGPAVAEDLKNDPNKPLEKYGRTN